MSVLLFIAAVLALIGIYYLLIKIEAYSQKHYAFKLFTAQSFMAFALAYGFIISGLLWYLSALRESGDTLNGIIIMAFGLAIVLYRLYRAIMQSSIVFGSAATLLHIIVYGPLSLFFIFIFAVIGAFLSNTRPVYTLNR